MEKQSRTKALTGKVKRLPIAIEDDDSADGTSGTLLELSSGAARVRPASELWTEMASEIASNRDKVANDVMASMKDGYRVLSDVLLSTRLARLHVRDMQANFNAQDRRQGSSATNSEANLVALEERINSIQSACEIVMEKLLDGQASMHQIKALTAQMALEPARSIARPPSRLQRGYP